MKKKYITWAEIKQAMSNLNIQPEAKVYGIPRGGQYLAAMTNNPVDSPEEADIIIDDLIETGETFKRYNSKYPTKKYVALFEKVPGSDWLVFPWEVDPFKGEETAEMNVTRILEAVGEDPTREGLKETPKRYMKFLREFLTPKEFNFTTFSAEGTDEMIVQTNIPFYSLCEHHIAPFFGIANVAYIPGDKIVGLSKLARTVDLYANKLQNQERITTQVAERLMKELSPKGVAVTMKAQHLCMCMRGVKKHDTWTVTSKMTGVFKTDANCRHEFLNLVK